jgi:hypothetical protein
LDDHDYLSLDHREFMAAAPHHRKVIYSHVPSWREGFLHLGDSLDWQVEPQVWPVKGPLFLLQCDLEAAFGEAPETVEAMRRDWQNRKPFPVARIPELKNFLIDHAREQERQGKPNDDDIARKAAEEHFNLRITREQVRNLRAEAGCVGQRGRPRKSAKK